MESQNFVNCHSELVQNLKISINDETLKPDAGLCEGRYDKLRVTMSSIRNRNKLSS